MIIESNNSARINLENEDDLEAFDEILTLAKNRANEIRRNRKSGGYSSEYTNDGGTLDIVSNMISILKEELPNKKETE